jgi:membrane protein implicated in regulation of membrane protease activity
MRMLLTALGVLMVLLGLLWAGQGAGLIRWPADSFMVGVSDWTWRGGLFALGGLLLIWAGRRR